MKKSIWLAIIGAAALTGCQSEVMQERKYVPAPHEDVEQAKPASTEPSATDRTGTEQVKTEQEAAPAVQELPPMTATFKNEGISEDAPMADTGKKGGKKGQNAGKGAKAAPGEYIVKSGDTPEKIARKHHVRLAALMEANNLTEESAKKLRIGQKLVIPAKGAAKGGKAVKGGKADKGGKQSVKSEAPAAAPGEYIVKSGDTPEKIARKHHVRLAALMEANNLSEEEARKLRIGQKLVIPAKGGKPAKKSAAKKTDAKKTDGGSNAPAPVPAGDGGNNAGAPDLEDGASTAAPAPAPAPEALQRTEVENGYLVDVPRDMTTAEFAKLAGVTEEELRKLNPNIPDTLKKDSSYIIPKN